MCRTPPGVQSALDRNLRMGKNMSVEAVSMVSGPEPTAHMDIMTAMQPESTSSLQRYLDEIDDPVLKANLANEFSSLQRQFGLVFERHHPEGIRLPKHTVKRGSKVVISAAKTSVFYRVKRIDRGAQTALVVDAQGIEKTYDLSELTVAKEFGDITYPGLRKLSEIRNGEPEALVHTVINGENYHALEALQYTHTGSVDLIYIDPPYNTGNADWKYNDRYIDKNDGYRHSKWLSFMEKRLLIAKSLLKSTGVIVMAIDDNEHARLKVLADQVFGESNFLTNSVWQGLVKNNARFTGGGIDYMLIYAASRDALIELDARWTETKPGIDLALDAAAIAWEKSGHDAAGATKLYRAALRSLKGKLEPSVFRYDSIDDLGVVYQGVSMGAPEDRPNRSRHVLFHPVTGKACPVPSSGWNCSTQTLIERESTGRIVFGADEKSIPRTKQILDRSDVQVPYPTFISGRMPGSNHVRNLFGEDRFPNPKDHAVLMRWFRMIAPKDAVILDFFGGSGSTAEAVIRLNAEDGGSRQCILVTNNELAKKDDTRLRKAGHQPGDDEYEALGVFHHVTKPRIETIVTGVREDGSKYSDGLEANVAFFDLTYMDEPEVVTGKAFNDLAGLFWLKAGGVGGTVELTQEAKTDGYVVSESGNIAVLFSPGRAQDLAEKLIANDTAISHLFIVTDSEAQGDEAASFFTGGITVERIYGSYLEAFQVNRKD